MAHRRFGTERIIAELPTDCRQSAFLFPVASAPSCSPSDHFRDATKMIPAARCFTAADLAASRSLSRIRERPPVPYYSRPPFSPSAASRSRHQPPHRRLLFLPKTAPFSSSVAFLTPPTFPAPAPRKRFFDPLPKKILGFRTRKGRLPRRQYLARARLEFRAGLRGVLSSRARAFGISCGLLACGAGG